MSSKIAFIYPGQGSQSVGMLKELASEFGLIENTFSKASEALGYDLWDLVQNGSAEQLNQTDVTQPALLTTGVAIWRAWGEQGGAEPLAMAGHSLGEYTALVCAGAMSLADGVRLVRKRGELMQQAVPAGQGAMAAILGLDDELVQTLCQQAAEGQVVSPVNYNSPGQVVIAGDKEAVERAGELLKAEGARKVIPLAVSVPSHCSLMKPAAEQLQIELDGIDIISPIIPVVNNVDATVETDVSAIKAALVRQMYNPVQWVRVVQKLVGLGAEVGCECGPGKVLTGLNKRIDKKLVGSILQDPAGFHAALAK
ncbi:MAG: ACP S-malonyltransferase [Pseudomonadales bacterium]|nr:ACP S-malonyltransferase [Pseudomonadales bacterium]